MIVVSDTSPILNLAVAGALDLLRALYVEVVIPPAVAGELERHQVVIDSAWMRVAAAKDRRELAILQRQLDPGEAEAILLALELGASLILVDEHRGRRAAAERGLTVMGLLGVLAEAKGRGLIPECGSILDRMIEHAGFWIADDLRRRFLRRLGEMV